MKDVAAEAGVSMTTVSRILRQERMDSFSPDTKKRVIEAADALGWQRNLLVRGIQTGRSGTIGVLALPFDSYWSDVLNGLHDELLATNHVPLLLWPRYDHESRVDLSELAQLKRLMERRVEAIATWPIVDKDALDYLGTHICPRIAVVTIDYVLPNRRATAIVSGEEQAATQVIDHLTQLGHRRIAYIGWNVQSSWATSRAQHIAEHAEETESCDVFIQRAVTDADHDPTVAELLRMKDPPTAIISATDHIAIRAIHVATQLGLSIPKDLSVVGYGNLNFELPSEVSLTTVDQFPKTIGTETAKHLTRRLKSGHADGPLRAEVRPSLIVRKTTGPVC